MTSCCDNQFIITSACYTVKLNMPIWGGENNKLNKQLQRFQFWTDNYAVHDTGINSQPLGLNGIEVLCDTAGDASYRICFTDGKLCFTDGETCYEYSAFVPATTESMHEKFIQLHEIMDNHEEVTITGLGNCMDAVYIIKDLRVDTIPRHGIEALSWSISLEKVRDI